MRCLRPTSAAATVAALTVALTGATLVPSQADHAGEVTNGGLLGEVDDETNVQQIDRLDRTSVRLPAPVGAGEFSPDGAALAYTVNPAGGPPRVMVRRANGTVTPYGSAFAGDFGEYFALREVRWGADGSHVVVNATGPSQQGWSLWRVDADGTPPVELYTTADDASRSFDTDPHSDLVAYVHEKDVHTVDARTLATDRVTFNCGPASESSPEIICGEVEVRGLSWSPTLDRMLVLYRLEVEGQFEEWLGWLPEGGGAPTQLQRVDSEAENPMVSPDGTGWAWNSSTERPEGKVPHTKVRAPDLQQLAGRHWSWQPCPDGTCATFVAPAPPSAPPIGKAVAGKRGKPVNAKAVWKAAKSRSGAIRGYQVEAQKLNARGAVVKRVKANTGPAARSKTMKLAPARYKFRVRAKNAVGFGRWSANSNVVRAR